jgi:SPP1 gp7 family putative phage head morphogenesis protein
VEFPVSEDWWPDAKENWKRTNYELLRGQMLSYIQGVNAATEQAVTTGASVATLTKQIMALDEKITKGKANFIARDQIGKLNGEITQRRMESVGLTMYEWETSGDERVRSTHAPMDGKLCRGDAASVYSEDGGKTWVSRPSNWCQLHPGMDYQCRCTAIAYWQELVGEADAMIAEYEELDALSATNIEVIPKPTPPATASQKSYRPVDKANLKEWEKDADNLFDKLSDNQKRALKMYSASEFAAMNRVQYDADYAKSLPAARLAEIKKMNSYARAAIDKGLVSTDTVVYRGEQPSVTASWKPGEIHKRSGFFSTSLSRSKAFITNDSVSIEIRVPAGARGAYIGHQSIAENERELLLQADSSFRVIERKGKKLVLELVI